MATDTPPAPKSFDFLIRRVTSGRRNSRSSLRSSGALPFCTSDEQVSSELVLCSFDEPVAPPHAVAPRAAAQQQHHVARGRRFAPHVFGLHGSHHGTHLQALGHVVGDDTTFAHVGRGQTDLVAVARITGRSLAADDPLGQFAGERLADGLIRYRPHPSHAWPGRRSCAPTAGRGSHRPDRSKRRRRVRSRWGGCASRS